MLIITDPPDFEPKDFVIYKFYGKETCFAWNGNEFVCFDYNSCKGTKTDKLKVYTVPSKIKNMQCFVERVFILCYPSGIYKLSKDLGIANLSKAGIEQGADFSEVISPNNDAIILQDKVTKGAKKLFSTSESSDVSVLAGNSDSTDKNLLKALLFDDVSANIKFCLISHNKNLFKMVNQEMKLIYSCNSFIERIHPVEKNGKLVGTILQTNSNVLILMHLVQNRLKYEKIYLDKRMKRLCAVIDEAEEDILLLICSDGHKTYYCKKKLLSEDSVLELRVEDKNYLSFKLYQSKYIIYLNSSKELFQVAIEDKKPKIEKVSEDYVKLEPKMLKGIDNILLELTDKSAEMNKLKEEVIRKEDVLRRINIFTNKQYLNYCPEESVTRLLNNKFLISNYKKALPENSILVKMLKNRGKAIFTMKKVDNFNTVIEMPICIPNLSSKLYTTTDLITYINEGGPWCLIKNYIRDPFPTKGNKIKLSDQDIYTVKHSLIVLKELMRDNKFTIEDLSRLKKKIREDIDCKLFKHD